MPLFSMFVLALWVLLSSLLQLGAFTDVHFTAWVGIVFVIVFVIECVLWARAAHPLWRRR
jgi:uncharacterized membrane protein